MKTTNGWPDTPSLCWIRDELLIDKDTAHHINSLLKLSIRTVAHAHTLPDPLTAEIRWGGWTGGGNQPLFLINN